MAGEEKHYALTANTAASVEVTAAEDLALGDDYTLDEVVVEVIVSNSTTAPIYCLFSGLVPTVRGAGTKVVQAGTYRRFTVSAAESVIVSFIGAQAGDVTVQPISKRR